jgi:hypothetical protein
MFVEAEWAGALPTPVREDDQRADFSDGLGLLPNCVIASRAEPRLQARAAELSYLGISLDERSAVVFDPPDRVAAFGIGMVTLFDGREPPGSPSANPARSSDAAMGVVQPITILRGECFDLRRHERVIPTLHGATSAPCGNLLPGHLLVPSHPPRLAVEVLDMPGHLPFPLPVDTDTSTMGGGSS